MSKLVNWGRWVVAAILVIRGFAFLTYRIVPDVIEGYYGRQTFYPVYMRILWSVPFFLCALGILKWDRWALGLATALCVCEIVVINVVGTTGILHQVDRGEVLAMILAGTPLMWLVLPSVQAEFKRRNQIA
jgi:hypothetical protein